MSDNVKMDVSQPNQQAEQVAAVAASASAPAAPAAQVAAPEIKTVSVNINVINNFKSLLEVAVARGTFKAVELSAVGRLYDELNSIQ